MIIKVLPYSGVRTLLLAVLVIAAMAGCHKKEVAAPAPTPTANAEATPAPVVPAAAQVAPKFSSDEDQMAAARAAMQAKDYQTAEAALKAPPKTGDQLSQYNKTKGALYMQVVAAAAAGDPQAKVVLDKMRQDANNRR